MATSAFGQRTSRLFFVLERFSHLRYLVDTGAEVSTIPPTKLDRQRGPATLSLQAANGSQISTYLFITFLLITYYHYFSLFPICISQFFFLFVSLASSLGGGVM